MALQSCILGCVDRTFLMTFLVFLNVFANVYRGNLMHGWCHFRHRTISPISFLEGNLSFNLGKESYYSIHILMIFTYLKELVWVSYHLSIISTLKIDHLNIMLHFNFGLLTLYLTYMRGIFYPPYKLANIWRVLFHLVIPTPYHLFEYLQ